MRRVIARLHDDERGAYMVLFAGLFAVVLAFLALSVDTGMLYEERHELQNAADAGALAVAFNCARGEPCAPEDADGLADANANIDGVHDVESVTIDSAAGEVTVVTRSEAVDGSNTLALAAARAFGVESATVRATATAAWGSLASAATIPFTISFCDLDGALADQGGYVDVPPPAGPGTVITFHDTLAASGEAEPCDAYPGFDTDGDEELPAGFGKLEVGEDCVVTTYTDENDDTWAPVKEGASAPPPWRCLEVGTVSTIPVFVDFRVLPSQKEYRIGGYAAFYVTGYRMPGYDDNPPCGGSQTCISGWFTEATVSDGQIGGVDDFGARTAQLIR